MGLNPTAAMDLRSSLLAPVDVPTNPGFTHYKMVFPTLRGTGATELMQIGEIQFYDANNAMGNAILSPADPILAIDQTIRITPQSSFPAAEHPGLGIDHNHLTKYLNFGENNSGLIITNAQGPVDVNFMQIRTANDAPDRDPASYELWGTNDPIQSQQHSNGLGGENWTLISSGPLSLPAGRRELGPIVTINSPTNYQSYKLLFPTVKNATAANSMQIADVQFATSLSMIPEPSTVALVALGLAAVAASRRRRS
jgi:hypothetical protein